MTANWKSGDVIVHFGMPKTGSSSIQATLSKQLTETNFYYVGGGWVNANKYVRVGYLDNPRRFPRYAVLSDKELGRLQTKVLAELKAELARLKQALGDEDQFAYEQLPNGVDGPAAKLRGR